VRGSGSHFVAPLQCGTTGYGVRSVRLVDATFATTSQSARWPRVSTRPGLEASAKDSCGVLCAIFLDAVVPGRKCQDLACSHHLWRDVALCTTDAWCSFVKIDYLFFQFTPDRLPLTSDFEFCSPLLDATPVMLHRCPWDSVFRAISMDLKF
jgi:hypothetical protein